MALPYEHNVMKQRVFVWNLIVSVIKLSSSKKGLVWKVIFFICTNMNLVLRVHLLILQQLLTFLVHDT